MSMDKLTMAHEYAKIMLKAFYDGNAHWDNAETEIPSFAFEIADAMQAEADKRAHQKRAEIRELLNHPNTFVEKEGQHFDDVAEAILKVERHG